MTIKFIMGNSTKLDQLRPILKECTLYEGGNNVVVEDIESKSQIVLPKGHQRILKLLDGDHSVKDISSELYQSEGQVSFHSFITTIKLLNEAHLLEGVEDQFEGLQEEKSPHEQKASLLNRAIFELKLFNRVKVSFQNDGVFFGMTIFLVALLFVNPKSFTGMQLESFLKGEDGYTFALLKLFFISSVLMSMKSLLQAGLLLLSSGSFYGPYLRIYPYAISLGINDNSIYSHAKKSVIITDGISNDIPPDHNCLTASLAVRSFFT